MEIQDLYQFVQFVLAISMYVIIPAIIIYKIIQKKKLPNNQYTPYDDMLEGRVSFDRKKLSEDNKHQIQYEERQQDKHNTPR